MERVKAFYKALKGWVRSRRRRLFVSGRKEVGKQGPAGGAPRSAQEPPVPASRRASEGWELWWPAGLAGLGIALTVLARWLRRREGRRKDQQG
jgi:hypothetical protein